MNKLMIGLVVLCTAFVSLAEEPDTVKIPGKGCFTIVNTVCDKDKGLNERLTAAANKVSSILMIETAVTNMCGTCCKKAEVSEKSCEQKGCKGCGRFRTLAKNGGGTATVIVVKCPEMPMSMIAMEEKWGLANIDGLAPEEVEKQVLRVATVILGGASSKYPASVMRPVFSKEELKTKAGSVITVDALMAIWNGLEEYGFKQYQVMDRADAIEEGLIPAQKK